MSHLPLSKKRLGAVLLVLCLAGALLVLSSLILSRAYAQDSAPVATYVSGSIVTDTTWTLAGSPYYIVSTVNITAGAQLTVEPGVRVIFVNKQWIHVYSGASIVAKGTPTQHITFERSGERWRKIWFHENTSSYFRYVDLAGGGSSSSGESALIEFDGPGTHVINNCTLEDSNHQGIAALGSGLDLTIAGTLIRDNDTYSLRVDNGPTVTVTGSTFEKVTNNDMVFVPSSVDVATFVITGSNFLNGATIVNQMASVTCVYAQNNWWGAADGPSGGGGGACTGVGSNSGSGSALGAGVDWRNYRTLVAPYAGIRTTPVATFTVSPDPDVRQSVGTEYTLDASDSTDVEDCPANLEVCWDWDNNGSCETAWATDKTDTYSFTTGGAHIVRLAVRDTDGDVGDVTRTILSTHIPTVTLTITQTSWAEFEFDASGSDDVEDDPADLEVRWDWEGDGVWDTAVYSVTDIVSHTYNHIGRYWPTVEVKDTEGAIGTLSKPVDVIPPAASLPVSGGGTLVSADGTITVTWASGVITDGAIITHTAWITAPVGGEVLPDDFTYQGFTLETTFGGQPVEQANGAYTITLDYDLDYYGDVLDIWAYADLLRLYQWSEADGAWVLVTFTIDSGQLVATTDSFDHFALVSEPNRVYLPLILRAN
jgi:hypothetical protein